MGAPGGLEKSAAIARGRKVVCQQRARDDSQGIVDACGVPTGETLDCAPEPPGAS